MTKKAQSKRTDPLDRDGDGHKGGSLPDNQTAPYAQGADGETPPQTEGEGEGAGETPAPDANPDGNPDRPDDGPPNSDAEQPADPPAMVTGESWVRDDALILLKLGDLGISIDPGDIRSLTEDRIKTWSDEDARAVEQWADAGGGEPDPDTCPDVLYAFMTEDPAPAPDAATPTPEDPAASEPTFSAEEIAAGKRGVAGEDGETVDQPDAVQEDLAVIQTDQAQVAVRIRELRSLLEHRRLYRTEDGYSATQHPPYISVDTVEAWTRAGLCEHVPSAGRLGGIKPTVKARVQFNQLTAEHGGR